MPDLSQGPTLAGAGEQRPDLVPFSGGAAEQPVSVVRVEFDCFYTEHLALLIRHLMRQGANAFEAAEAAQAAFTEAFVKWERIEHPAAWLRQVAYRLYLRQQAKGEHLTDQVPEQPSGVCPLRSVEVKEEAVRVYEALAGLPPAQRRVFAWFLDGFTTQEIARELGMTCEAVRQNIARARARLKAVMGLANGSEQE